MYCNVWKSNIRAMSILGVYPLRAQVSRYKTSMNMSIRKVCVAATPILSTWILTTVIKHLALICSCAFPDFSTVGYDASALLSRNQTFWASTKITSQMFYFWSSHSTSAHANCSANKFSLICLMYLLHSASKDVWWVCSLLEFRAIWINVVAEVLHGSSSGFLFQFPSTTHQHHFPSSSPDTT